MSEWVMTGWGVNGYTASTASALLLRMMARSVVNMIDLIRLPKIRMPRHRYMVSGTLTRCLRSSPLKSGVCSAFMDMDLLFHMGARFPRSSSSA